MAQTPAIFRHPGDALDYTAGNNGATVGQVVVSEGVPLIVPRALAATEQDAVMSAGVWDLPKKTGQVHTARKPIFWDATGSPRVGDNNSGAADNANGVYLGMVVENAANNAATVRVKQDAKPGVLGQVAIAAVAAGAAANNAGQLLAGHVNVVTAANNNTATVKLPLGPERRQLVIINRNSATQLSLLPNTGQTYNGGNNAATIAVNTATHVFGTSSTAWVGG